MAKRNHRLSDIIQDCFIFLDIVITDIFMLFMGILSDSHKVKDEVSGQYQGCFKAFRGCCKVHDGILLSSGVIKCFWRGFQTFSRAFRRCFPIIKTYSVGILKVCQGYFLGCFHAYFMFISSVYYVYFSVGVKAAF